MTHDTRLRPAAIRMTTPTETKTTAAAVAIAPMRIATRATSATRAAIHHFGLALALAAILMASQIGQVRAKDKAADPGLLTVSAEGTASLAPDMALISLTVLREANTARQALNDNNTAMAGVLEAMKTQGIAERDLQTSGFSIQPRYDYTSKTRDQRREPEIVGYQVSNSLTVRIRDLERVGEILDLSVTLGVNQGGNIIFTNDNADEARDEARKDAIAKALARAELMTQALGVGLGRITLITEQSFRPEPRPMMARAMANDMAMKESVPVAAGENTYSVTVNVSWEIKQ